MPSIHVRFDFHRTVSADFLMAASNIEIGRQEVAFCQFSSFWNMDGSVFLSRTSRSAARYLGIDPSKARNFEYSNTELEVRGKTKCTSLES